MVVFGHVWSCVVLCDRVWSCLVKCGHVRSCVVVCGSVWSSYLPQVDDEAVSLVEAGPAKLHLRGPDGPPPFDVQQAFHVCVIGHHVLEARGHSPLLW